jgi:antitoxin MazE
MATRSSRLELTVAKWGNSLAVRLPAESARLLRVGEGDILIAEVATGGRLILAPEGSALSRAAARGLRQFVGRQKETVPVVAGMRRDGRY